MKLPDKITARTIRWLVLLTLLTLGFASPRSSLASPALPTLSINDVSLSEDSCQGKTFVFTVTLSKLPSKPVTVNYATSDGSSQTSAAALAGQDYVPASGTLIFTRKTAPKGAGGYLMTVSVPLGNYVVSAGGAKSFTLTLSGAVNATISKAQGVGTLLDAASSCVPSVNASCSVNFCGASVACAQVNRSAVATPYCTLAGQGITPSPDPNFAECSGAGSWADSDGDGFSDAAEDQDYIDMNGNGVFDAGVDFRFPHADFTGVVQAGGGTGLLLPGRTDPGSAVAASSIVVTINSPGQVGAATFSYTIDGGPPVGPMPTARAVDIPGNVKLGFANGQVNPSFAAGDSYSFSAGDFKVADKNRPNAYVQYDYMDWTTTPSHACTVDADCVGGGGELFGESCHLGYCNINEDPERQAPGAISKVVAAYAAHGITLYVDPLHQALPYSQVVSWRAPQLACEGADVAPGVLGAHAVNFFDLKKFSSDNIAPGFDVKRKLVYHYAVFAHYSGCDYDALGTHCGLCPSAGPDARSGQPSAGQSGMAEIPGNDFIVSLGHWANDQNHPADLFQIGGTFMHELGHNFGLRHGGDDDGPNWKPNYLSVMNYNFQVSGITSTDAPPADPVTGVRPSEIDRALTRLDYSEETVKTLDEVNDGVTHFGLDEPSGLACGGPDALSVFGYSDDNNDSALGSCTGPVNWDITDADVTGTNLQVDLNQADHTGSVVHTQLTGHTDWGPSFIAAMPFQCAEWGSADGASFVPGGAHGMLLGVTGGELTLAMAAKAHVLYLPMQAQIAIQPSSAQRAIALGKAGEFHVTLLGADDLDVREVELSSLRFQGAAPLSMAIKDVNGDARLDLALVFSMAQVRLNAHGRLAHLTGWLKNSQVFIGEDAITFPP